MEDPLAQEFVSWRDKCKSTIRSTYQILSRGTPNLENETWNASVNVIKGTETPEAAAASGCRRVLPAGTRRRSERGPEAAGPGGRLPPGPPERISTKMKGERDDGIPAPVRWHIAVFLAPAVLVYTAIMICRCSTRLRLSLYTSARPDGSLSGWRTLPRCSAIRAGRRRSGTRWATMSGSSSSTCWCRTRSASRWRRSCRTPRLRMAAFYRSAIFIPTILSFVIVGFVWKLILSPIWGIAPGMLDAVGLKALFAPWLGRRGIRADDAGADLGLAVRRHPDDADLCRPAVDPRGDPRGRRDRWTSPVGQRSGRSSCP